MKKFIILGILAVSAHGWASSVTLDAAFDGWVHRQASNSRLRILDNLSPADGLPGAVLASPSHQDPDYYFHWIRDAALTMSGIGADRTIADLPARFYDFFVFTRVNQSHSGIGGLGEPKYMVDGTPYTGDWGRPQNDGPALRAGAFIENMDLLLADGRVTADEVWQAIELDLDYVATHIYDPNIDLWEENWGQHFYTRMVQRWALVIGGNFANQMGHQHKAAWYWSQAQVLDSLIGEHFRFDAGQIVENINNLDRKPSGLDSATILAINHTKTMPLVAYSDPLVLSTVSRIIEAFNDIYPINRNADLATAIGRYPEDLYNGAKNEYGNPWFLTTLAVGEFYYELSRELQSYPVLQSSSELAFFAYRHLGFVVPESGVLEGVILRELAIHLIAFGDRYLERARVHMDTEGRMSEQMDRHTGFMRSARDLTWSYVSFLTAIRARNVARWMAFR